MPGVRCAVAACSNSYLVTHRCKSQKHIKYHHFPSDPDRSQRWAGLCGRYGKWNPKNSRICSAHFRPDDFERDLRAELMHLPPKGILKKTAEPSLLLTEFDVAPEGRILTGRGQWRKTRSRKSTFREILKDEDSEDDYLLPPEQVFVVSEYDHDGLKIDCGRIKREPSEPPSSVEVFAVKTEDFVIKSETELSEDAYVSDALTMTEVPHVPTTESFEDGPLCVPTELYLFYATAEGEYAKACCTGADHF